MAGILFLAYWCIYAAIKVTCKTRFKTLQQTRFDWKASIAMVWEPRQIEAT